MALSCSVLADKTELVPVWVTDRELARAIRSVEERLDHLGTVPKPFPPRVHISDAEVVSAGTGSSSEIANCVEPVWKWAYFGSSGGQWPCAGSPRISSYQATALPKSL